MRPAVNEHLRGFLRPPRWPRVTLGPCTRTSPASPGATSSLSASTIRIFCPGNGGPTVPALRFPSSGLAVLAHDPSDSPYPSMSGMQVAGFDLGQQLDACPVRRRRWRTGTGCIRPHLGRQVSEHGVHRRSGEICRAALLQPIEERFRVRSATVVRPPAGGGDNVPTTIPFR